MTEQHPCNVGETSTNSTADVLCRHRCAVGDEQCNNVFVTVLDCFEERSGTIALLVDKGAIAERQLRPTTLTKPDQPKY